VIDRRALARELDDRKVADWVIIERDQELGVVDETAARLGGAAGRAQVPAVTDGARTIQRAERRTRWQLVVHADTPAGRGTAHVAIDAFEGDPSTIVDQALELAEASVGPAWETIPAAAPARVELADPALLAVDPLTAAGTVFRVARPPGATIAGRATVVREHVHVTARQGLHTEWQATRVQAELLVTTGARSLEISRAARRRDGLALAPAIVDAVADLELLASAGRPVAGPCALVLGPDAMLYGGHGVWAAFAMQADAVVARQGLTRYHEQEPIAPGADQVPEPLTITSNGALSYGLESAPLGDDGDAVRRFALVDRGIAAGLGLSPREAALRHREPNGGVRNLMVALGTWSEQLGGTGRTIEVRRLRALEIDRYTGEASLEVALAIDHTGGATTPFAGGTIRLDLVAALARARRSKIRLRRGGYEGPRRVWIEHAELIA
jgi:predicted Zn-dependent protease